MTAAIARNISTWPEVRNAPVNRNPMCRRQSLHATIATVMLWAITRGVELGRGPQVDPAGAEQPRFQGSEQAHPDEHRQGHLEVVPRETMSSGSRQGPDRVQEGSRAGSSEA
ncbi:hypothetical protein NCC78_01795 [Micromonospora phytophila]|uniref:hypothetical protein n=1 Tax=Micromonospora phytophila TaxID=709888 RepID=UPI00202DE176|nr:hypothetical protein [Micromonospora phytophila]MCM0673459.1 hypothetical protein [Micromonospora phytophila]